MKIEILDLKILRRHPIHVDLNVEKDVSILDSLRDSTMRYGKVTPVVVIYVTVDGVEIPHAVDGWSSVIVGRINKQETIPCVVLENCPEDELPHLVASIHANYHNDPEEDYKRFKYFHNRMAKGRGFRSDLKSSTNDKNESDEN